MSGEARIDGRKHILHVIDALTYGGAQELLVLLARWTPKSSYRTTVCVLQPNPELKGAIESQGVRVVCFDRPRPSILKPHRFFSYFCRNVRDIVTLCRRESVDVVQCHLSDAEFVGIFAGYLAKVKRILTTLHYPDFLPARRRRDPRNLLRRLATRILYGWTDAIIAVSEDIGAKVKGFVEIDPAKVHTILNRIDVDSFRGISPKGDLAADLGVSHGHKVILSVGRLMPPKGHVYLIEAVGRLAADHPAIRLLLAGDGDLRGELEAKCISMGILNRVRFLGSRSDVADLLALADIFVLPSLWEGTSLALLEAMAAARPIVATDIPGNAAVLGSIPCGALVPAADGKALAEAISHFLAHPEQASECGLAAARVARDRFDIQQSIAQLELLWKGAS